MLQQIREVHTKYSNRVYVSVRNGNQQDGFMCDPDKVEETIIHHYGELLDYEVNA
jgi:hypothetical protein